MSILDPSLEQQADPQLIHTPQTYVTGVPFQLLDQLRRDPGIVWMEEPALLGYPAGTGYWLVLRHADVQQVMRQPQLFSSWLGATQIRDPGSADDLDYARQMMLNMDPPEHARLRRLLHKTFTPTAIAQIEAGINANANMLVKRVIQGKPEGTCDFGKDIAADLPLLTLADVLGVPKEDRLLLFDWANRVIGYQDPDYAVSSSFDPAQGTEIARSALAHRPQPNADGTMPDPRGRHGMPDLDAYARLLAEEKRRNPGDDVMSLLLSHVGEEGLDDEDSSVTNDEFKSLFWLFAVAGNETLRNGIPGGMICLLEHAEPFAHLCTDPSLLETAVDEMLRWWTPVMTFRRTATADCAIGSQKIQAGDKVVVSFISANRDETVFENPNKFDITRSPNPHLSFGYGPHFCIGAHLARAQMRAIFKEVIQQMGQVKQAGEIEYLRSNFQRGVKKLPIRWRKAQQ